MKKTSKKKLFKGFKSAIRCIAFLCILFLLIVRSYDVLSWKDTLGDYLSSVEQLYATEDDMMDVVFMGSSHTYCSISPALLWGENGIAAFNMTTSGQDKDSTYHYLVELLKTQSPEVVCVELYGLTFDEHVVEGNRHRNMLGMPLSENSIALIDEHIEDEQLNMDYKLRWPIVHTRYKELDMYDFVEYDFSQYGRGIDFSYEATFAHYPVESLGYYVADELTESNKEWLDKLYQLSIDEDFELVLFVAPAVISSADQGQFNAAVQYAEERGLTIFDFNRKSVELGFDYTTDFLDHYHLNGYGAEKLTRFFGEFLTENYDLADHREDNGYEQWDKSYTRYLQVKAAHELNSCETFDVFILKLKEMENITCIVSFEGDYIKTIPAQSIAWMLDMSDEDYKKGGTFFYQDGKLERIMYNDSEEVYIKELSEYNTLKIQNMNLEDASNMNSQDIMINLEVLGACNDGVNFVVYDNVRNEVIDTRGFY